MGCGIYKIENIIDNKVYVGGSVNMEKRMGVHFSMLRGGYHDNRHLQKAWNKCGEEAFDCEILTTCNKDELVGLENYFIESYMANGEGGYNMALVNESRRNIFNEEVKQGLSKHYLKRNGNFVKFVLMDRKTRDEYIFESLTDAAHYLKDNGFANGKLRNIRMKLSAALRGIIVNNGHNGSIRKTCYKHNFEILN